MKERDYIIATNQARLMIALEALRSTTAPPADDAAARLRAEALRAVALFMEHNTKQLEKI